MKIIKLIKEVMDRTIKAKIIGADNDFDLIKAFKLIKKLRNLFHQ